MTTTMIDICQNLGGFGVFLLALFDIETTDFDQEYALCASCAMANNNSF